MQVSHETRSEQNRRELPSWK